MLTFVRNVAFSVDDFVESEVDLFEQRHSHPHKVPGFVLEESESADDLPVSVVHELGLQSRRQ